MIWIISGPTSAGKSTFIASRRAAEVTGLPSGSPVVWPATAAELTEAGPADAFFHYNILRPLQQQRRQARLARKAGEEVDPSAGRFEHDEPWIELRRSAAPKRAVVLVASKQTLLQRVARRRVIEEEELRGREAKDYPNQKWLSLLEEVDLLALYRDWCQELRDSHIPYLLVDSGDDNYPIIESEEALEAVVNGGEAGGESAAVSAVPAGAGESKYSRDEVLQILQEHRFGYHRIDLPYGLRTRGQDRSKTRDIVLPESLAGKSVLDVGSAHGYFCFEAEARGAARVVGVEPREDRFQDALLLKEIKGSKAEFMQRDILLDPLDEPFDYVLLLNVVHHLSEPVRAIRQLASITREKLIIEFPTLADPKFHQSLATDLPSQVDDLPLIGVSSMRTGVGQTFVFTPAAVQRILTDHAPLCAEVEIVPSPMPGRAIALCHVGESGTSAPWARAGDKRRDAGEPREQRRSRRERRRGGEPE